MCCVSLPFARHSRHTGHTATSFLAFLCILLPQMISLMAQRIVLLVLVASALLLTGEAESMLSPPADMLGLFCFVIVAQWVISGKHMSCMAQKHT